MLPFMVVLKHPLTWWEIIWFREVLLHLRYRCHNLMFLRQHFCFPRAGMNYCSFSQKMFKLKNLHCNLEFTKLRFSFNCGICLQSNNCQLGCHLGKNDFWNFNFILQLRVSTLFSCGPAIRLTHETLCSSVFKFPWTKERKHIWDLITNEV